MKFVSMICQLKPQFVGLKSRGHLKANAPYRGNWCDRLDIAMPRPRKPASPFLYLNSSPEIIRLVVMMYGPIGLGRVFETMARFR